MSERSERRRFREIKLYLITYALLCIGAVSGHYFFGFSEQASIANIFFGASTLIGHALVRWGFR